MDLSVRKKGRERDVIVVVVVCERYASAPDPDVDNGYGVGSRWGGERYTCKGGRLGRPGVHLASLSKLLGMGGGAGGAAGDRFIFKM